MQLKARWTTSDFENQASCKIPAFAETASGFASIGKFLWAPGADIFARARHLRAQNPSVYPMRDGSNR